MSVRVIVRVRPPDEKESQCIYRTFVKVIDNETLIFDPKEEKSRFLYSSFAGIEGGDFHKKPNKDLQFMFDRIFDETCTNSQVFEGTTRDTIASLLDGYNCSVFAYGASLEDKTRTMLGSDGDPGITFRTMSELFAKIDAQSDRREFNLGVTYLEIYNENVLDLLHKSGPLAVRDDGRNGVIVAGLEILTVHGLDELLASLARGNENRTMHAIEAYKESSRSHTIFQVHVNITNKLDGKKKYVKLSMIDLAGSVGASKIGCKSARLKERASINKSLLALGNCISNLANGRKHITYRDSKLTYLLKDSLHENSKIIMIANLGQSQILRFSDPLGHIFESTCTTLRYADRFKKIKSNGNTRSGQLHPTSLIEEQKKQKITASIENLAGAPKRDTMQTQSSTCPNSAMTLNDEESLAEVNMKNSLTAANNKENYNNKKLFSGTSVKRTAILKELKSNRLKSSPSLKTTFDSGTSDGSIFSKVAVRVKERREMMRAHPHQKFNEKPKSSENLGVPGLCHPTKRQSMSPPAAMDHQNGFGNGTKEGKIENYAETQGVTMNLCQGSFEFDRGRLLSANFPDMSPIRSQSPMKRAPGDIKITATFSRETKNYMSRISSPKSDHTIFKNSSRETSFSNGSSHGTFGNQTSNNSSRSEKSFIQQRVEHRHGPGALAHGFFFKRAAYDKNTSESSFNESYRSGSSSGISNSSSGISDSGSNNSNDRSTDNGNSEESLKNLPVLRHLEPEFSAQFPVVNSCKATDGTEHIIKPSQSCNIRESDYSLSASVTSISDQRSAKPEVVEPVLETSSSSASLAPDEKTSRVTESPVEEKRGHHFMRLLSAERDGLLRLAESAEAELANADPATLPEEAEGELRSAAGKARLLVEQKIQQFEELCRKNISDVPGEKFPTTREDLAGFWDMVMLQVVQVNDTFAQIEKLKSSQWREETTPEKSVSLASQNGNATKRRLIVTRRAKTTATSEANRRAREAREQMRRKMMDDRRRAIRSNAKKRNDEDVDDDDEVTIFAPETSNTRL